MGEHITHFIGKNEYFIFSLKCSSQICFHCLLESKIIQFFETFQCWIFCCCCLFAKSCRTLWDPVDCSPPGFSVHGISEARVLKGIAISFSTGSSWPKDRTCTSCVSSLADGFFTTKPLGKPKIYSNWRGENLIPRLKQLKNSIHCSLLSKLFLNEMTLWSIVASNHFLQKVNLCKYFIKIKLLTISVFNFYARDLYLVSSICFPGGASGQEPAC